MRILLVGEFSRLHNSLKEGLEALGHDVTLISSGDGFKNLPSDFSTRSRLSQSKYFNPFRKLIYRIAKLNIAEIETGIRFERAYHRFPAYDVIQFINERPIQTTKHKEFQLLKMILEQNDNCFLLSCGSDYVNTKYLFDQKKSARYHLLTPYFEKEASHKEYSYILDFLSTESQQRSHLLYQHIRGVIASDFDYVAPLKSYPKYLGLIPNPINVDLIEPNIKRDSSAYPVKIFLGINRGAYYKKGISFFEEALKEIKHKYAEKVEITVVENVPYQEYNYLLSSADIVLDQIYSYDQGYNALESMAKGKVVFTGAEQEFTNHYNIAEHVCENALPDLPYLVERISFYIENTEEIARVGQRARDFVFKHHHYINIAKKYLAIWEKFKK